MVKSEFADGIVEDGSVTELGPKTSTTPVFHSAPHGVMGYRQISTVSDLSHDMAEARWDILHTLLLEERQARVSEVSELRNELSFAKDTMQIQVTKCQEIQKHIELALQELKDSPSTSDLQEAFKSSLKRLQHDFDESIAQIEAKLAGNTQYADVPQKYPQTTISTARESSVAKCGTRLAEGQRIVPSAQQTAAAAESQEPQANSIHGPRPVQQAKTVQASVATFQPFSLVSQPRSSYRSSMARFSVSPHGESRVSVMQRNTDRATPLATPRDIRVPTAVDSPSRIQLTHQVHGNFNQERSHTGWTSPLATFRVLVPPPITL